MTITMNRIETEPLAAADPADGVLGTLRHTVVAVSQMDPDLLHAHTAAGRAVVTLAGEARAAVAALGADPGTALGAAPGVVVVRDLAVAVALLERTASRRRAPADLGALHQIANQATAAYGRFLLSAPALT